MKTWLLRFTLLIALVTLAPGPAFAQYVAFIEQPDTVLVEATINLCGGPAVSSRHAAQITNACMDFCPPSGGGIAFLVEPPGSPYPGAISDVVSFDYVSFCIGQDCDFGCGATLNVYFTSLPEGAAPEYPPPGIPVLVEDGTLQLVTSYFTQDGSAFPPPGFDIYVQSTLDLPIPAGRTTWGKIKGMYR